MSSTARSHLAATIAASIGVDFALMPDPEQAVRFPRYREDYGDLEVFHAFATIAHAIVDAILVDFPDFRTPDRTQSFWDLYHDTFSPGGILSYDVPPALWHEMTDTPFSDWLTTGDLERLGQRTYQRLKTPPATPDLPELVSQVLAL